MTAMHDDTWIADTSQASPPADSLQKVLAIRDKRAANTGEVSEHWDDLVRRRVAAVEHDPATRHQPGHWQPDEWETKARAVIDYRDRIADSVPDPVPSIGTPEWASSDWRTKTAAYARHEGDVAAAQGPVISNRMAAECGWRRDLVESSGAIAAEWMRRGYDVDHVPFAELERRRGDAPIPEQRKAEWTPAPQADAGAARVRGR